MSEKASIFGSESNLLGILNLPQERHAKGLGVILMNAGMLSRTGPNRLNVKIARRLAELGIPSIRIDFSGLGDSAYASETAELDLQRSRELGAAMDLLGKEAQVNRFVLIGICSGGWDALMTADKDRRVVGLTNLEGIGLRNSRYVWRRMMDPGKWWRTLTGRGHAIQRLLKGKSKENGAKTLEVERGNGGADLESQIGRMLERGVRMLFCYREGNEIRYAYRLKRNGERIRATNVPQGMRVEFIPEADHTFTLLSSQHRLMAVLEDWLEAFPR